MSTTHPDDQPERRSSGLEVIRTPDHNRVFCLVRDYGGLPLSSVDVHQELGISHRRSSRILFDLAALGVLSVKDGPSRTRLYFVEEAL